MPRAGAKSKYDKSFAKRAERYCARYNATDKDLAAEFNVTERTINGWKRKYPHFRRSVNRGREHTKEHIEYTLRQLAMPHDEVIEHKELQGEGEEAKLVTVSQKIRKGVVNVSAAMKVLAADDPERFGNKVNIGGQEDNPVVITDPEKQQEIKKIAEAIAKSRLDEGKSK